MALAAALGLLLAGAARAEVTVVLRLDLRPAVAAGLFDPARDGVGLRGATAPLSWQHTLLAEPEAGPGAEPGVMGVMGVMGIWRVTLRLPAPPAQPLAYKIKIERPGQPDAGWEPGRNHSLVVTAAGGTVTRAWGDEPAAPPLQRTGQLERIAPQPSRHVTPREVQVWLPPGYGEAPARRYPVLYLHDGQNVFDAHAAGAEWQLDEHAQALVRQGAIEPLIVVAVASGDTRLDDYTPVPQTLQGQLRGGGAARYARYLVDELKPLIDARYRTRPGRADTAVGGSSLGGLVSMWLLLNEPDTFGAGWVVSPAVWWGGEAILAEVARRADPARPPRLWLDIGLREGDAALAGARRLRDALAARGWATAYQEVSGAGHDEAAWAARVPAMLRHLHARPAPAQP
jgi:predicted alpha/beta superfamily hydrolase